MLGVKARRFVMSSKVEPSLTDPDFEWTIPRSEPDLHIARNDKRVAGVSLEHSSIPAAVFDGLKLFTLKT